MFGRGLAGGSPEEGDELLAGEFLVGAEHGGCATVGDVVGDHPRHGRLVPDPRRHVREPLRGRHRLGNPATCAVSTCTGSAAPARASSCTASARRGGRRPRGDRRPGRWGRCGLGKDRKERESVQEVTVAAVFELVYVVNAGGVVGHLDLLPGRTSGGSRLSVPERPVMITGGIFRATSSTFTLNPCTVPVRSPVAKVI